MLNTMFVGYFGVQIRVIDLRHLLSLLEIKEMAEISTGVSQSWDTPGFTWVVQAPERAVWIIH